MVDCAGRQVAQIVDVAGGIDKGTDGSDEQVSDGSPMLSEGRVDQQQRGEDSQREKRRPYEHIGGAEGRRAGGVDGGGR